MKKWIGKIKVCVLPVLTVVSSVSLNSVIEKEIYEASLETRELVLDSDASLEDIYISRDESLSEEAKMAISSISNSSYHGDYIDLLGMDLDTVEEAYANFVPVRPKEHEASRLYDKEKQDINWDLATETILDNTYQYFLFHQGKCQLFSEEELLNKIEILKKTANQLKEDFPDYDLEMFACNLEKCHFIKQELESDTVVARVSENSIIYNEKCDASFLADSHEAFHYLVNTCSDVDDESSFSHQMGGIHIAMSSLESPGCYRNGYQNRFQFLFLEEIYAELYASEITKEEQNHYLFVDEVLTFIQLILGLQEDYQIDTILENMVYQDPIAFIQNFPVYGEEKDLYFIRNCQMLKSCDILLKYNKWYLKNIENASLPNMEEDGISELKRMALDQMEQTFFNNLILLNELHPEEMDIEDNIGMIKYFYHYEEMVNSSLTKSSCAQYGGEFWDYYYVIGSNHTKYRDIMFQYLSDKKKVRYQELEALYYGYGGDLEFSFLDVLGEEKKEFYQQAFALQTSYDVPYPMTLQKRK